MQTIGIIGIGNIGRYFTRQLREAQWPVVALDSIPERLQYAVDRGATPAKNPAEVAANSEIVVLCLPGSHAVQAVMEGEIGILSRIKPGQLVIDTGTSRPATAVHYEMSCAEKAAAFIDAPITWRSQGLIIMVGGKAEAFEQGKEVLTLLSFKLKHIGPIGQGQILKMMNQAILAGQLAVNAEIVEFTKQAGLDPQLLEAFLGFSIGETLLGDDFSDGGTLALHYKDLGYALEFAHDKGANIPLTGLVHEAFKQAKFAGDADWSQPGVVTYWRKLNEVSSKGK
jgi:3-hydroxyisobutyrate dehydrogenase-like beta-hydroxyacid dehydrogenase